MISKEQIRREREFYEDIYASYEKGLKETTSGDIYFKYQHGAWRPYLWEDEKEKYLSQRKNHIMISNLLENRLIRESLVKVEENIELLRYIEERFTDIDELLPGAVGKTMERNKGRGFCVSHYLKDMGFTKGTWRDDEKWLAEQGPVNPYRQEMRIHKTMSGIKVRSKSELAIGTFLDLKKIPYKYEELLIVEGNYWYPDFKIRRLHDGKTIIWEHLGMMDDPVYAEKNQYKLMVYARNGYRVWDNLIVTYDENGSLDMTMLDKIYEIMLK